ncbi:MAG: hypothetical protein KAS90_01150 [Candidatus Aenigmarchaeota archaeon]|nr:hypothetical protein [Candidatus Aenigmarchaeota archaeon]
MAEDSSEKIKEKIQDAKSGAAEAIENMKKEKSGGKSGSKGKSKSSGMFMLLSFFEDLVKKGGDILLAFVEFGLISKKTIKNFKYKAIKSFVFIILVLLGALLLIRGIITYIEFVFPQLANGLGFVFVGLIILSVAYLYHK